MFNTLLSFRVPKHSRQSARPEVKQRRRLRVERMESRLMLSATSTNGVDPAPFSPYLTYYLQGHQVSLETNVSFAPKMDEGGYINADRATLTNLGDWHLLSTNGVSESAIFRANSFVDSIVTGNSQAMGSTNAWTVDYDGMHLSIIPGFADDTSAQPTSTPIIGFADRPASPLEGGAISIPTLLTSLKRENTLARSERLNSPLDEKTVALTAVASKSVSSELARATVFEVMGGAGDSAETSSLDAQRKSSSAGLHTSEVIQPLSSINSFDSSSERADTGSPQANKQDGSSDAGSRRVSQSQIRAASGSYSDYLRASNALLDRSWFTTSPESAAPQVNSSGASDADTSDNRPELAAAFEKFGNGETAVVGFKSDGELLGRLANASPLLLILALERISSLQGRRARRQEKPQLQKPLRSVLS